MDSAKKANTQAVIKKVLNIASYVLLAIFLSMCIFTLILTVFAPKDQKDGTAELFGYQLRVVISNSMAACDETDVSGYDIKSIPLSSMVFVKLAPTDDAELEKWYENEIKEGDVLTVRYLYDTQVTITHRVTEKTPNPSGVGYTIVLEGDNKNTEDVDQLVQTIDTSDKDSFNYILGKVTGQSYFLGMLLSFLRSALGIIFVIIFPCVIIILIEVIKIVKVLRSDKVTRYKEESAKKDEELQELRRKLAELQTSKGVADPSDEGESGGDSGNGEASE